jgi:hypothetical protein
MGAKDDMEETIVDATAMLREAMGMPRQRAFAEYGKTYECQERWRYRQQCGRSVDDVSGSSIGPLPSSMVPRGSDVVRMTVRQPLALRGWHVDGCERYTLSAWKQLPGE